MSRKPDALCAGGCGKMLVGGKGALPRGERMCRDCRRHRRQILQDNKPRTKSSTSEHFGSNSERQCEICGSQYRPSYGLQRTCSRQCGVQLRRLVTKSFPSLTTEHDAVVVPYKRCLTCDDWFVGHNGRKYCSDDCRPVVYEPAPQSEMSCPECGVPFSGTPRRRFCSRACCKRATERTRRHRNRANGKQPRNRQRRRAVVSSGENFTTLEIAERDNWRCHLCRKKVTRNNWSIDHLVPIAAGGEHVRSNVAIAHHLCNSLRRDVGPAQLRLVG